MYYVLMVLLCVLFCVDCVVHVLFVCKCVLYYCHRVSTQLQLNISYHISAMIFNCGVILAHYNCTYILVLITLQMATRVAEKCRRLLCNKITFINLNPFWSF